MSDHYDRYRGMEELLGTNLAEVGTDCSEFPNNSDAISRQQAIDAFYLYPNINWTTLDILKKINEMPTIRPKRGRWHYSDGKPATIGLSFGVICDQCGTESEYCTNFCGECGADMRGEEHGLQ